MAKLASSSSTSPRQQGGQQRQPEIAAVRGDELERLVGLEQERLPVRPVHARVDLEHLVVAPLVPVLRRVQIGESSSWTAAPAREQRTLVLLQLEALADQPRLVRVDDAAVRRPDLDPLDGIVKQVLPHLTVERRQGRGIAAEQGGCDEWLHDGASGHQGLLLDPLELVFRPGVAEQHQGDDADDEDREDPDHRERRQGQLDAPQAVNHSAEPARDRAGSQQCAAQRPRITRAA